MHKLCVYVDKLDSVEPIAPGIETFLGKPAAGPGIVVAESPTEPGSPGTKLLWPRIYELNPKIAVATILCNYAIYRALEGTKRLEGAPKYVPSKKSTVLFLLAVPNDFSLSELADWLGTAAVKIKAIRMVVLPEATGYYSMLLYFDSVEQCEAIYEVRFSIGVFNL